MDGGLILNLATDDEPVSKRLAAKKGGRWTDRLKVKRVTKRKQHAANDNSNEPSNTPAERPAKRPRTEPSTYKPRTDSHTGPKAPSHIISSLFSYNPIISKPSDEPVSKQLSKPSNAPINASTFKGLGLSPLIIAHLESKMSITKPTGIQRAALPALLQSSEPRDAFIQSQTGSGKTLSFLLPIIQDLLPLSSLSYIDRSIGTLAIIIAPTRELAKQISDVLEALLTMRLRPTNDTGDESADFTSQRLTRWLVSGLLTGGATRTHEKARLRKGVPILVSTPGRLLDHLQNTASFNVGKCRWLVLDEADRLMDLGFEESIDGILKGLDGRRRLALNAIEEGKSLEVGGWDWRERRNILCSATIREDVQKLAGVALKNPLVIKALGLDASQLPPGASAPDTVTPAGEKFTPPSQLSQKYVVVPLKLRLVTLVALLRSLLASQKGRQQGGTKILVFLSCTDSVDFHWALFGGTTVDIEAPESSDSDSEEDDKEDSKVSNSGRIKVESPFLPETSIYRLHGSLPLQIRLASLNGFSKNNGKSGEAPQSSILLCTSVASRGLDLPLVRAVIQYDLPTEGGATEYIHRVGRTARAGKGGEAWSFVSPSEEAWVPWVQERIGDSKDKGKVKIHAVGMDTVLKDGFGGQSKEYEIRATQIQLAFERWVLIQTDNAELARKAYVSHMRAYATHPSDEKHIFHIRHLHLGHLAKSFALREAPNMVTNKASKTKQKSDKNTIQNRRKSVEDISKDTKSAEERMKAAVRAQGKLSKKDGTLMTSGTSEFQIANTKALEKLVRS
ncbi:hypothetical protein M422DRAFT_204767 [Sphaerobolus stellatus SS14]|nr:hypothetical protein M422DRAFT_204767 [Sphaerobolus stellatus SS14]